MPEKANAVTVLGLGKEALFSTCDACTVQWRDSSGDIVALLVRLKPDIWGFSKRGDYDWDENLAMHGAPDA